MKRKTCTLYLSCEEYGVILDALIRFKNKLTQQGRYTDIVDEVILALLDAKTCLLYTSPSPRDS